MSFKDHPFYIFASGVVAGVIGMFAVGNFYVDQNYTKSTEIPVVQIKKEPVFKLYRNAALPGCNDKKFLDFSVEECKQACVDMTEFKCKSFDFYKGENTCDLSRSGQGENCSLKTDYLGNLYDHYELVRN